VRLPGVSGRPLRLAVVGHVEWVQFARVEHVPAAGDVVHAADPFEEPAGGGAVAAVQLARLAGACTLFTALGRDELGRRSISRLSELGVTVRAGLRDAPTRRAVTFLDRAGERTITTFGERLDPLGNEQLGWEELHDLDGVYFTAGDRAALARCRNETRVLAASPRARHALGQGIALDALILSGEDEIELRAAVGAEAEAELLLYTEGERGGRYRRRSGEEGRWEAAALPGPPVDSYGCGDSFASGLTYGLAAGLGLPRALELAARCGAACLAGDGPYGGRLPRLEEPGTQK
jgi:ribokinase